jgi:uncharacterized BrkB/YihY/UPF0761 family membrane protein
MPDSDEVLAPVPNVAGDSAGTAGGSPQVVNVADAASEHIIDLVGKVKARTTLKVVILLRVVVYGLVVAVALVTALVLAVLGLVRIWDAYIPLDPVGRRVWLGYVVVGGLLFLGGAALLGRRRTARR